MDLIELNKKNIYDKLDKITKIDDCWLCNDVIDALSQSKESDRRLINNYDIVVKKCKISNYTRNYRFFTRESLIRYVHESNIYGYINVCNYLKIDPIDKKRIADIQYLKKYLEPVVNIKVIIKWLFEKPKKIKELNDIDIEYLKIWLETPNLVDVYKIDQKRFDLLYDVVVREVKPPLQTP